MTHTFLFNVVSLASIILPTLISVIFYIFSPKPNNSIVKIIIAILIGWLLFILFTMYIYNPVGIAIAKEQGVHFPESKFDNNTIASAILGGWFYPAFAVGLVWLWRKVKRKV